VDTVLGQNLASSKHEIGWFRRGSDPETETIFPYRVAGLASREEAAIAELPYRGWRILRWKEGHPGVWYGAVEAEDQLWQSSRTSSTLR